MPLKVPLFLTAYPHTYGDRLNVAHDNDSNLFLDLLCSRNRCRQRLLTSGRKLIFHSEARRGPFLRGSIEPGRPEGLLIFVAGPVCFLCPDPFIDLWVPKFPKPQFRSGILTAPPAL